MSIERTEYKLLKKKKDSKGEKIKKMINKPIRWWKLKNNELRIPLMFIAFIIGLLIANIPVFYIISTGTTFPLTFLLANYLKDRKITVCVDLEEKKIEAWEIDQQVYNIFKKKDWAGKDSTAKWKLKCKNGEAIILDKLDRINREMIINKWCSNILFTNRFREKITYLSKIVVKQARKITELTTHRELDKVKGSHEIYEQHPIVQLFRQVEKDQEKELQTDEEEQEKEELEIIDLEDLLYNKLEKEKLEIEKKEEL